MNGATEYAVAHPEYAAGFAVQTIVQSTGTHANALGVLAAAAKNAGTMRRLIDAAITERELTDGEAARVRQSVCEWFAHDLWEVE